VSLTDLTAMAGADPFGLMAAEATRIHRFYSSLDDAGWAAPTRCADWDRRDLLAHLAALEDYVRAGLDGRVAKLTAGQESRSLDERNAANIARRAGVPRDVLLAQWYAASRENVARLREYPPDATMDTAAGPYPAHRQGFYLASELAIHADDAGIPVPEVELPTRRGWRVRFGRLALDEAGQGLMVSASNRGQLVRLHSDEALLSDDDFVEATAGRLPREHPLVNSLRKALAVLA
jgi:uncharacterized protein (TIGR03083 family)